MAKTIAVHISPKGTESNSNFLKEVEQANPALVKEITCLDCDQTKVDILKNANQIFDLKPYYIILSCSMPLNTIARYRDTLFANDLFNDTYRRDHGLWVVTHSNQDFRNPELGLEDDIDGYYSNSKDLILDLLNAPHAWLEQVVEPDHMATIRHYQMYCKKRK